MPSPGWPQGRYLADSLSNVIGHLQGACKGRVPFYTPSADSTEIRVVDALIDVCILAF